MLVWVFWGVLGLLRRLLGGEFYIFFYPWKLGIGRDEMGFANCSQVPVPEELRRMRYLKGRGRATG